MEKLQIKKILSNYILSLKKSSQLIDEVEHLLQTLEGVNFVIRNVDSFAFYQLVKNFKIPEKFILERESLQKEILMSYYRQNLDSIKESLCGVFLHNNPHNSGLIFKTINERAIFSAEYKKQVEEYTDLIGNIDCILSTTKETRDNAKLSKGLSEIFKFADSLKEKNETIPEALNNLFYEAKSGFQLDLIKHLSTSFPTLYNGIQPEEVEVNGSIVKIFKMQNQTDNQRDFQILTRSIYIQDYLFEKNAMQKYQDSISTKDYLSFSLFNPITHKSFSSKNRITFGYSNLGNAEIISCNTHDGQTNQYPLSKNRYIMRQEFLPIQNFLEKTPIGSYNEIVLDHPKEILPCCIISEKGTPNEDVLKIASNFNLPIIYIDEKYYQSPAQNLQNIETTQNDWYNYEPFLKSELVQSTPELTK